MTATHRDFIRDNVRLAVLLTILAVELAWVAAPYIVGGA